MSFKIEKGWVNENLLYKNSHIDLGVNELQDLFLCINSTDNLQKNSAVNVSEKSKENL